MFSGGTGRGMSGTALPGGRSQLYGDADGPLPPADFAVSYQYVGAAMPPVQHCSYVVEVAASGAGTLEFHPGYEREPRWTYRFQVGDPCRREAYLRLLAEGFFAADPQAPPGPSGGARALLRVTSSGCSYECYDDSGVRCEEVIRALVPDEVWMDLTYRRERHTAI